VNTPFLSPSVFVKRFTHEMTLQQSRRDDGDRLTWPWSALPADRDFLATGQPARLPGLTS